MSFCGPQCRTYQDLVRFSILKNKLSITDWLQFRRLMATVRPLNVRIRFQPRLLSEIYSDAFWSTRRQQSPTETSSRHLQTGHASAGLSQTRFRTSNGQSSYSRGWLPVTMYDSRSYVLCFLDSCLLTLLASFGRFVMRRSGRFPPGAINGWKVEIGQTLTRKRLLVTS